MNRTFQAKTPKTVALSRLLVLLLGETALFGLFLFLGSAPARRVDFANLPQWLNDTPPADALVAVAVLIGALGAFWLFASTLLYAGARLMHLSRVSDGLSVLTLPVVRRMVDGALAVSIAGTTLLGAGRMAGAASMERPAAPITMEASRTARAQVTRTADLSMVFRVMNEVPEPAGDGTVTDPPATPDVADSGASDVPTSDIPEPAGDGEGTPPATSETPPPTGETPPPVTDPGGQDPSTIPDPAGDADPPTTETTTPPPTVAPPAEVPPPANDVDPRTTSTTSVVSRPENPDDAIPAPPAGEDAPPSPAAAADPDTPRVGGQSVQVGTYSVQPGDNFWVIAQTQVERSLGRSASDVEVRDYWVQLIEANRANISSGNPNLIFPGEQFVLPPVA